MLLRPVCIGVLTRAHFLAIFSRRTGKRCFSVGIFLHSELTTGTNSQEGSIRCFPAALWQKWPCSPCLPCVAWQVPIPAFNSSPDVVETFPSIPLCRAVASSLRGVTRLWQGSFAPTPWNSLFSSVGSTFGGGAGFDMRVSRL